MSRSQESWNKKEREKKKEKKKKEKEERRQERKKNAQDGSSLDDMIAYIDEFGNITDTPPDPTKKTEVKLEDIEIGVPKQSEVEEQQGPRTGTVSFFNESKGFGFIKDDETKESIFVHANGLTVPIKESDKVIYEVEMGRKGLMAVNVKSAK